MAIPGKKESQLIRNTDPSYLDLLRMVQTPNATPRAANGRIDDIVGHNRRVVSVRWFGAVADGVTDDAPSIQAAIDSLGSAGGTVFFPATSSFYSLNGSLTVPSGVTLMGQGVRSKLKIADAAELDSYQLGAQATKLVKYVIANESRTGTPDSNIVIRDLYIDCNGDNQAYDESFTGILLHNATHVDVVECTVYDAVWGIDRDNAYRAYCLLTYDVDDVLIFGGRYERAGYECLGIRDKSKNVRVTGIRGLTANAHVIQQVGYSYFSEDGADDSVGLVVSDCALSNTGAGDCFTADLGRNFKLVNCTLSSEIYAVKILNDSQHGVVANNSMHGGVVIIQSDTGVNAEPCHHIVVANNVIRDDLMTSAQHGISIKGCSEITVSGNDIDVTEYAGNRGINIADQDSDRCENITITGNKIAANTSGIKAAGSSRYISMLGNVVSAGNFGIVTEDTADYCAIVGNVLKAATTPLSTVGSNNQIANNIV
jgi:hypothetical protein